MKPTATAAGLTAAFLMLVLVWAGAPAPAVAQEIQVNSADPASAPQGTVNLTVTIKGKGFKRGAGAQFFVTGTGDTGGIRVNSTSFTSPSELVANIEIADNAEIAKFDIQVQNADGRTGKGTELFAVTEKGSEVAALIPVEATLTDATTDRIRSDRLGLDAGSSSPSSYSDSEVCVIGWVDNTTGRFFLRVEGGGDCDVKTIDRKVVFDFSDALERAGNCQVGQPCCLVDDAWGQAGVLDICGVNVVTDVRIIADTLFQNKSPSTTPVTLPFSLSPDFRHTGFELQFELSVPASGDISTARTVTAGLQAIAELYKFSGKGGKRISLGRFRMPFEIVVTLP